VSGGADGANAIPGLDSKKDPKGLWYSIGAKKNPAGYDDSLAINNRSEADFKYQGVTFQGTMAAWKKAGYGNHASPYANPQYGYDPNDPSDAALGKPESVQYKYLLAGIHGNAITVSDGYRIHPKDITETHGCIGVRGYDGATGFESWMSGHSRVQMLVE